MRSVNTFKSIHNNKKIVWDIGAYLLITEMCSHDIASNES